MKRLLIILAVIVLLLGVAVGVYFFFFSSTAPRLTTSTNPFSGTTSGSASSALSAAQVGVPVTGAGTAVGPNLVQITQGPVTEGNAVFDMSAAVSTTGSTTVSTSTDVKVRFIDRQSGNIYEYGALSRTLVRITAKTLPGIQKASWLADGSMAFAQFLAEAAGTQTLDTYALPASNSGGYFLSQNLSQASVTGSSTLLTISSGSNTSVGTIQNVDGSGARTLFTSPLTQINVQGAQGTYIAVTNAAESLPGYVFRLSAGGFTPIIGSLSGLTALLSPSGTQVLYSYTDGTTFHMSVLNLSTGASTALPIATIASKCAWKADSSGVFCAVPTQFSGTLPDDWYQGAVSFNDRIWNIDLGTRLASLELDPNNSVKSGIDAISLTIDPAGKILTFMNKKDGSLWAYSL